ncbi:MAG: hypothetical protein GY894_09660 [Planctomycetes bacterium]|nr:hypothetical protein [Planctomycetota bacterium]
MFKQTMKRTCVVIVVAGACGWPPAIFAGLDSPSDVNLECAAKFVGNEYGGCAMPPKVCPNGPFTGYESCKIATSHKGCAGVAQPKMAFSENETGRQFLNIPCGTLGLTYSSMKCQCFGNFFGSCWGPCEPSGGIAGSGQPCPGDLRRLVQCEVDG